MRYRETNKQNSLREQDLFCDYFKEQLEDHQMPIDHQSWDNIYSRIKPKKKKGLWIAFYSSAAAVILLLLFFSFGSGFKQKEKTLSMNNQSTNVEKRIEENQAPSIRERPTNVKSMVSKDSASSWKSRTMTAANEECDTIVESPSGTAIETVENSDAKASKKSNASESRKQTALLAYEPKTHSKWEISVELGSSKGTSESQKHDNNMTLASCPFGEAYYIQSEKKKSTAAKFAPSITIGLLARKRLNATYSIETGLTYSYLSTTFNDENNHYDANLSLHYVGIPLNMVADIWNVNSNLKIYASAGLMAEKGIKSDYYERNDYNRQSAKYDGSIKGVQWSLNASAGLSYHFYQHWNLYLEPHLSNYFDNNQPTSIRTEKRTLLGLNSGFRYDF